MKMEFRDGIISKCSMNATHTFTDPGLYNVTLTVTDMEGSNAVKKPNYVKVKP